MMTEVVEETIYVYCRLRPPIAEDLRNQGFHEPNEDDSEDTAQPEHGELVSCLPYSRRSLTDTYHHIPNRKDPTFRALTGYIEAHPQQKTCTSFTYRGTRRDTVSKAFSAHGFFGPQATQRTVYDTAARSIVDGVCKGYNGTVLAYGATGSGKTWTMRGQAPPQEGNDVEAKGLIERAFHDIFEFVHRHSLEEVSVSISYVQIYCELLQDLLDPLNSNLSIRESNARVYVEGASRVAVQNIAQCRHLLEQGDANRATACTKLNATSSRSHAALLIHLARREDTQETRKARDGNVATLIESTLCLVDLAGSERAKFSGSLEHYKRAQELKSINFSLSALGNCISALSTGRPHVPFRDTKLTRLLQQSLGGNARTCVIVNLPPGPDYMGETYCSLLFAQRAMKVTVTAKINRQIDYAQLYGMTQAKLDSKDDLICQLQAENTKLMQSQTDLQAKAQEVQEEKTQMDRKFCMAESRFAEALHALQTAACGSGSEQAVAAIESVNEKWQRELSQVEIAHAEEIQRLKAQREKIVQTYRGRLEQANEGWQATEMELTAEREGHLQSLTEYRECHERLLGIENETSARIGELSADVNEKIVQVEELQGQLQAVQATVQESQALLQARTDEVAELKTKIGSISAIDAVHTEARHAGPKAQQVQEMEELFSETVGKLEDRVSQLEDTASSVPSKGTTVSLLAARTSMGGGGASMRSRPELHRQPPQRRVAFASPAAATTTPSVGKSIGSSRRPVPSIQAAGPLRQPVSWASKRPLPAAGHISRAAWDRSGQGRQQQMARMPAVAAGQSKIFAGRGPTSGLMSGTATVMSLQAQRNRSLSASFSTFGARAAIRVDPGQMRARSFDGIGAGRYRRPIMHV